MCHKLEFQEHSVCGLTVIHIVNDLTSIDTYSTPFGFNFGVDRLHFGQVNGYTLVHLMCFEFRHHSETSIKPQGFFKLLSNKKSLEGYV